MEYSLKPHKLLHPQNTQYNYYIVYFITIFIKGFYSKKSQKLKTLKKMLDPACGSGNFLYVALKQLLDLEKEVITFGQSLGLPAMFPQVSPEQLYGIEINEYAHELAQVTVWIGYIQWMKDNGFGNLSDPILKPLDTIQNRDAILAFDNTGQPIVPIWPSTTVIIGNPPFLGGSKIRRHLGDTYTEALWSLYGTRLPAGSDLVTYWFEQSRYMITNHSVYRAGLIATQGIRSSINRHVLERINEDCPIFMAWSDRPWILDGASVRVSLIGFGQKIKEPLSLNGIPVPLIHADLSAHLDFTQVHQLRENEGLAFVGSQKVGPFDLGSEQARLLIETTGNPHGKPNRDVVKPSMNAFDVMGRFRNRWIIDFGAMTLEEAALYEAPFEYVKIHVYPVRQTNRRDAYAIKWWLHGEYRPALRKAIAPLTRYLITPRVSKHRVFVWLQASILPDHKLCIIARDDWYCMGIVSSRLHTLWSLSLGSIQGDGSTGGRPVYSVTRCFETFPFPWAPGSEPQNDPHVIAITTAAQELVQKRDNWLNPAGATEAELKKRTLTNLYNERPTWLDLAHQKLDKAVLDAYGWPHDLSDEHILERLLALNLERAVETS